MRIALATLFITAALVLCAAFIRDEAVRFTVPPGFPEPVYRFANNPVTPTGFALGRKLFYETALSIDSSIACDNCHQPFAAFANADHPVSHGVNGCLGTRNAPPLFNLPWQKTFMWDGGVTHIEVSPLNALTSPCEMASNLDTVTARLKKSIAYRQMFRAAFGSDTINSQRLLRALAQFTSMLISAGSKYDKYVRHEPGGDFTADEEAGYALFKEHCSACHTEPLFTDGSYRNNGLDIVSEDPGRDSITNNPTDKGKFKVPSLRNVGLTSPYMHDGRFETLREVLEHYSVGVKANANLDTALQKNGHLGIPLNALAQKQLVSFLKTLNDSSFINNKLFQNE